MSAPPMILTERQEKRDAMRFRHRKYLVARSFVEAERIARARNWPRPDWVYVSGVDQLRGLSPLTTKIYFADDPATAMTNRLQGRPEHDDVWETTVRPILVGARARGFTLVRLMDDANDAKETPQ